MTETPRRVLVIGGTGFLGRRISEAFVQLGDRVSVLSRGQRPVADLADMELLQADRRDPAAMRATLGTRSFDVVVDNIAYDGQDVQQLFDVLSERVGHYIQISS